MTIATERFYKSCEDIIRKPIFNRSPFLLFFFFFPFSRGQKRFSSSNMSEPLKFKIVAVDGGAATGKSSTSRAVASNLQFLHVDTGAHYRTLTYALLAKGASSQSIETVEPLLSHLSLGTEIRNGSAHLMINGYIPEDTEIRSQEVNANVSKFAAIQAIRTHLFNYQRSQVNVAQSNGFTGLIMEGRDIGSVIFPDADFRFFLYADEATRAARRAKEGQTDSISTRDKMDSSRKTAPLTCPEGATRIDTGPLSLDEVIKKVTSTIQGNTDA